MDVERILEKMSLFHESGNIAVPKYVTVPAKTVKKVSKGGNRNSSSEAAVRRIKRKEAGANAGRKKNDPRIERTVFIGNIPCSCSRKDVKKLVKDHGSVESIRLRSIKVTSGEKPLRVAQKTQKQLVDGSSFNAYIVFSSLEEAESCRALNGTMLCGRHLRVDRMKRDRRTVAQHQRSVFVGNLPFSVDEEKLRDVFIKCGDIEAVRVVRDSKTGVGKGFGYVMFVDKSGVMFAVRQTKKIELDGRCLRVNRCRSQHQQGRPIKSDVAKMVVSKKIKSGQRSKAVHCGKRSQNLCKSSQNEVQKKLVATKYSGKRRPDGTKNRLYRLPAATACL